MPTTTQTTAEATESGRLTIDLDAVRQNYAVLARQAQGAEAGAVVKADAYGLGVERVAPALWLAGARRFYVAQLEEGLALRTLLPTAEIVVMAPAMPECLAAARAAGLVLALNSPDDLVCWRADGERANAPVAAQLHFDTGMTRLGFDDRDAADLWGSLSDAEAFAVVETSSHLACADQPDHPANRAQLDRFQAAVRNAPVGVRRSLANSSGIFLGGGFLQSCVRPGMALYGLNPTPGRPNPMRAVVRLEVRTLQVRTLARAETVGYGATATAPAGARIATIAAGYADGLHRALSGVGAVYYGGRRAPILGRISMDLIAVDVTEIPETVAHSGAFAEAIGARQTADDLAEAAGTIGYEILTSLGRRYRRTYRGGPS